MNLGHGQALVVDAPGSVQCGINPRWRRQRLVATENYRCCHIDEALIETEDATQYVPPAKPAPTDDTTGDHGRSKKKQTKGSEWPVVVGVVLALVFLMAIGIGCSLWARGARVDPSDSKAAAAAPGEETEEPLQVV